MKGQAESVVVKIVIALLILGVIVALLYIGLGPFRAGLQYNACVGYLKQWCVGKDDNTALPKSEGPCKVFDRNTDHLYYSKWNSLQYCKDV